MVQNHSKGSFNLVPSRPQDKIITFNIYVNTNEPI